MPLKVSFGHGQITSTDVGQAFLQLMLPLGDHVYHRSELGPFLCDRKSIATYAFLQHSVVEQHGIQRLNKTMQHTQLVSSLTTSLQTSRIATKVARSQET